MIDTEDTVVAINSLIDSTHTVSVKCVGGVNMESYTKQRFSSESLGFVFYDRTNAGGRKPVSGCSSAHGSLQPHLEVFKAPQKAAGAIMCC